MKPYVTEEQIRAAKAVNTLAFLLRYQPERFKRVGRTEYAHCGHDSLKVSSNGKWNWHSRGVGGTTAVQYLVPFPVSWTVKMKKKQKETQDILSYHTQAAGCSDKARAKASGGRQPIEECGRTGL